MLRRPRPNIAQIMMEGTPIDEAFVRGIRRELRRHKKLGEPVVVWQNGGPVLIPPQEIPDFDDDIPPTRP
jgi:hypothetical protein